MGARARYRQKIVQDMIDDPMLGLELISLEGLDLLDKYDDHLIRTCETIVRLIIKDRDLRHFHHTGSIMTFLKKIYWQTENKSEDVLVVSWHELLRTLATVILLNCAECEVIHGKDEHERVEGLMYYHFRNERTGTAYLNEKTGLYTMPSYQLSWVNGENSDDVVDLKSYAFFSKK